MMKKGSSTKSFQVCHIVTKLARHFGFLRPKVVRSLNATSGTFMSEKYLQDMGNLKQDLENLGSWIMAKDG